MDRPISCAEPPVSIRAGETELLPEQLKNAMGWIVAAAISLEFVSYFLGLRVVTPYICIWLVILLGSLCFLAGGGRVFHWVQVFWLVSTLGLLATSLVSYIYNRTGASFPLRWFFAYAASAFFPLLGGLIAPRWVYNAASALGVQSLIYCVVMFIAIKAGINVNYNSPIPSPSPRMTDYFAIKGYEVSISERRPVAFTPHATYAGAVGCFYFLITLGGRNSLRKWLGLLGWLALIYVTASRTAQIGTLFGVAIFFLLSVRRRYLLLCAGIVLVFFGIGFETVTTAGERLMTRIANKRPTSSEVRSNLRQLAYDEWAFGSQPFVGINTYLPGGRIVAEMPVGSHDSIYGTLMIRGIIGFFFLLTPIVITVVFGFVAGLGVEERICAATMTALLMYSYTESTESIYLFISPVFLMIGFACRNYALRVERANNGDIDESKFLPT